MTNYNLLASMAYEGEGEREGRDSTFRAVGLNPAVERPVRVAFCWSNISGYMAACWRRMAADPVFDLHVLAYESSTETAFGPNLMADISWTPLSIADRQNATLVVELVAKHAPDVVVIAGWLNPAFNALPHHPRLASARFVMGMDTPWRGDLRQLSAPIIMRDYLRGIDAVVVTGERSWRYARHLQFPEECIFSGLYGIDYDGLAPLYEERTAGEWPRSFLFAGRYHPEKAVDVMVEAYRNYRMKVGDPWPLICCGTGELQSSLVEIQGVTDQGFVQPADMLRLFKNAGAFVLPSRYDPWPLALLEACAAGLPAIASNACGSAVECLRDTISGRMVATGNAGKLTEALVDFHRQYDRLPAMGAVARTLAAPYSTEAWVEKWRVILSRCLARPVWRT